MRKLMLLLAAMLAGAALLTAGQPPAAPSLLIRNVTLIDGNGGSPIAGVNVAIRGGRISAIGTEPGDALLTIDGRGLFAMPGLTDAHVHLSGMPWAERAEQLKRVLRGGV